MIDPGRGTMRTGLKEKSVSDHACCFSFAIRPNFRPWRDGPRFRQPSGAIIIRSPEPGSKPTSVSVNSEFETEILSVVIGKGQEVFPEASYQTKSI
jgi:hypothetical protein